MNNLVEIGYIIKTHGYKGDVKVKIYDDIVIRENTIDAIFLLNRGEQTPHFVERIQLISNQNAIILFEEFKSKEEAHLFKGSKLFVSEDKIERIEEDGTGAHEYVGYLITDSKLGKIGYIEEIYEFPHQDLLAVKYNEKEVLIPFDEDLINEIQPEKKTIIFNLPEGLLEI